MENTADKNPSPNADESLDESLEPTGSLVDFMRRSPLFGTDEIAFERDRSVTRDIVL